MTTRPAPAQRSYLTAGSVAEAVAALSAGARAIAGGTDLVVGARHGKAALPQALVGIHRIGELARVQALPGGGLSLGALVSHAAIVADPLVRNGFAGLADASAIVGSHATRANGTIGGNVMNSSPAMDTGAPLLCHDAVAVLTGPAGTRRLGLAELWTGPGTVSSSPDELLVAIELPGDMGGAGGGKRPGSAYVRLQYRRQMEIAIVGAGAVVTLSGTGPDATITGARIAITALAPVIHRVAEAEQALIGTTGDDAAARAAGDLAAAASRPISDVRGSAPYRRAMAAVVARRAITAAVARARGEGVPVPASDSTYGS